MAKYLQSSTSLASDHYSSIHSNHGAFHSKLSFSVESQALEFLWVEYIIIFNRWNKTSPRVYRVRLALWIKMSKSFLAALYLVPYRVIFHAIKCCQCLHLLKLWVHVVSHFPLRCASRLSHVHLEKKQTQINLIASKIILSQDRMSMYFGCICMQV